jgi:hypothetical protein
MSGEQEAPEVARNTSTDWKSFTEAIKSCMDIALRLLIAILIILVLVAPGLFPFLGRFMVKSGEVNLFGSKFEVAEIGTLMPGLEVRDNRIFLHGTDITTYPDTVDRLTTANNELTRANKDLSDKLTQLSSLLAQIKNAPDPTAGDVSSVIQQKAKSIVEQIAGIESSTKQLAAPAVAATAPSLFYGLVFSGDRNKDEAMFEVNKAKALGAPISLYLRENSIRSVAGFATREAAVAALPSFRAHWQGAYVVDLRTWCPAGAPMAPPVGDTTAEVDCRF